MTSSWQSLKTLFSPDLSFLHVPLTSTVFHPSFVFWSSPFGLLLDGHVPLRVHDNSKDSTKYSVVTWSVTRSGDIRRINRSFINSLPLRNDTDKITTPLTPSVSHLLHVFQDLDCSPTLWTRCQRSGGHPFDWVNSLLNKVSWYTSLIKPCS